MDRGMKTRAGGNRIFSLKARTAKSGKWGSLFPLLLVLVLTGSLLETPCLGGQSGPGYGKEQKGQFNFPMLNPRHKHMRLLLENAFGYVNPAHAISDPASGYPAEGWNPDLRSFTQLTAIGEWIELLANIVAGYADNPYLSRREAMARLSLAVRSLRADQDNPALSAKGLLVNFLGLEGPARSGPLLESVEREQFTNTFGEKTGNALWKALEEKGWILPEARGQKGRIRRGEKYGAAHFDGALAPFADEPLKSEVMKLLDRRIVLVIFGDNVNLTASLAKSVGALLRPEIKDDPEVSGLRREMESFIEAQKSGYSSLYDEKSGTFLFGWDVTANRAVGWDDGNGNWVHGQMNSFINEFRGPWTFAVLRYGLPEASIRNAGFKIKPYRTARGNDIHVLAAWEGSAFQLLGLSLFMQEQRNPGWKRCLENVVAMELDYSGKKGLPGFLSEAYSGRGSEYTGYIGIADVAVTDKPLITHAPSLYTLGVAYMVAPEKIEKFLESHWSRISGLFTDHGPWEGYNTSTREIIRFQTTVHTLSLILGGLGSAQENMNRYLESEGLSSRLEKLYEPGDRVDLLTATRGGLDFVTPNRGVSLSNGMLRIRYRSKGDLADAHISFKRNEDDPFPTPSIPIEIFTRFRDTKGQNEKMEIVLPATPALRGIKQVSIVCGTSGRKTSVGLSILGFEFIPFDTSLTPAGG